MTRYVTDMYYDQDEDVEVHAVLDTETSVWYFGADTEEGAQALVDELNNGDTFHAFEHSDHC